MSTARARILARLRQGQAALSAPQWPPQTFDGQGEARWQALQLPMGALDRRFEAELKAVGSRLIRVSNWEALPAMIVSWLNEMKISSVVLGTTPRLGALHERLKQEQRLEALVYETAQCRSKAFTAQCGITTSRGGIAESGSVLLLPGVEEPRLLSLAPEVHLAIVERQNLFASLGEYLALQEFQSALPANLVLASGASRTADIEMVLAQGVHGPRSFAVMLVG